MRQAARRGGHTITPRGSLLRRSPDVFLKSGSLCSWRGVLPRLGKACARRSECETRSENAHWSASRLRVKAARQEGGTFAGRGIAHTSPHAAPVPRKKHIKPVSQHAGACLRGLRLSACARLGSDVGLFIAARIFAPFLPRTSPGTRPSRPSQSRAAGAPTLPKASASGRSLVDGLRKLPLRASALPTQGRRGTFSVTQDRNRKGLWTFAERPGRPRAMKLRGANRGRLMPRCMWPVRAARTDLKITLSCSPVHAAGSRIAHKRTLA